MTTKAYVKEQMKYYGFTDFNHIPDEMMDYLPENLDRDEDQEEFFN